MLFGRHRQAIKENCFAFTLLGLKFFVFNCLSSNCIPKCNGVGKSQPKTSNGNSGIGDTISPSRMMRFGIYVFEF